MNILEKFKSKKYAIAGALALAIVILAIVVITSVYSYATEEYWAIKIGEKTIAIVNTESSANAVIEKVKNNYVKEGAEVKAISCDPLMSVEQQTYRNSERPDIMGVNDAVSYILTGTKEPTIYTVKNGDTLWGIALENGFTVAEIESMNEDKNLSLIHPGDELNLYVIKPFVTVSVTQKVTEEKNIDYKTIKKSSSEVLKNMTVVKQSGAQGTKTVTENITTENDKVVDSEVIESKVTKESKAKIIVSGTGTKSAPSNGNTYDGSGSAIASYALKYVGNPYVYGGESLTSGADCSGFVKAVYAYFGVSMAHDADAMRNYGKSVSLGSAQPGDLVCYSGHIGIYIGGGQIVHAVNEGMGIAVTGTGYIGGVVAVKRIVE